MTHPIDTTKLKEISAELWIMYCNSRLPSDDLYLAKKSIDAACAQFLDQQEKIERMRGDLKRVAEMLAGRKYSAEDGCYHISHDDIEKILPYLPKVVIDDTPCKGGM